MRSFFKDLQENIQKTSLQQTQKTCNQQALKLNFSTLEIADELEEQMQGLMYRQELCANCGMLFIYPEEGYRSFWMKNTYISLDMIFLDKNGRIMTIYKQTEPLSLENKTSEKSMYILEVPANFSDKFNLKAGDCLDLEHLLKQGTDYIFYQDPYLEIPKKF